jgi:DNA-binding protein YbaB
MFDPDPDHVQRRVSAWARGFADKAAQVDVMRAQVEQIQASASTPDGAVRVTVDSRGLLTDVSFTDRIRETKPAELAAQVMTCLQRAQQQLAAKVQHTMQTTVGDVPRLVADVVSSYRHRFGEELSRSSGTADSGMLGLGAIEEDNPPHRTVAPSTPGRLVTDRQVDEEYFADRGYLS